MPALVADHHRSRFLELPGEIRELVYDKLLCSSDNLTDIGNGYKRYNFGLSFLRLNKQVYYEARRIFRRDNHFVCIETPWEEAHQHVSIRGYVPVIAIGTIANRFKNYHLKVTIDAPEFYMHLQPQRFIILLDDLRMFCKMWSYSDLSHPGLNRHLRLTLTLHSPYDDPLTTSTAAVPTLPKSLQQRLLSPFGMIKDLSEFRIQGSCSDTIQSTLKAEMAIPYTSPEQCLEDATKLKDAGNTALGKKQYTEAIRLYEESFLAMHIVVTGRSRSVWADPFFQTSLSGGPFDGQHGHIVRLILRVRLVANIVLAYLKLENWDEARFWGMRTINIMRETTGADEPIREFVAARELGKIYYRTGLAAKEMGDLEEARGLVRTAAEYLPNDPIVRKELVATAPRLG